MARRKAESNAEALMRVVAFLPWWVGVLIAFALWVAFHGIATSAAPQVNDLHQLSTPRVLWMMARAVAPALQYILPFLCLLGAMISFAKRRKRVALAQGVTESASAEALNGMTWREFEMLVGEAFRLQGFEVREQGQARPDGGVDVVLRKGNETFLVQCKQWKAMSVGVDVVRELYGVMAARGAAGGFVVTSGRFTKDAVAFADGRNVRLVDGPKLFALLQQGRAARAASGVRQQAAVGPQDRVPDASTPACPNCNAPMVRRTAKKGANAGAQFWGCSKFPACYGTR